MSDLILYFIESTICVLLLFLLYKLLFSSLTFFHWRRYYWLLGVGLSLIIPALHMEISATDTNPLILYPTELVDELESGVRDEISAKELSTVTDETGKDSWLPSPYTLTVLYMIIVLILLIRLATKFFFIIKTKNTVKKDFKGYQVVESDQVKIPYTFLNKIYFPKDHSLDTREYEFILEHEKIHVFQRHTLDIIFLSIVKAFFWFNPLYTLILKDIKLLHEYIADDHVSHKSSQTISYAKLLLKLASAGSAPALVHNFSKLQIKERIIMLKQKKNRPPLKMMFLLGIPLIIFLIFSFSIDKKSPPPQKVSEGMEMFLVMNSLLPGFAPVQNSTPFGYPLSDEYSKVSSGFGMAKHPVHNTEKMHHGIDMPAPIGTPVYATAPGVVTMVKTATGGYGKHIKIVHGAYETLYAHLSAFEIKVGDKVTMGQLIGRVGNTGLSTEPHLHYEVIKDGKRVDPEKTGC
ncbi:M23/M56 family metallopeptidase [Fulvivirgaceae bacterium BMA12]|uniref:M23/M56 family metallopeptidase n=1 Tax=Agaribacillus aureus TaxID=3051825 RepID=A0ABT8LLF6_9BACT|nr:M23/M56 family metallopeptidase [Fulvivirgaceae bacterium BMA12]